MSDNLQELILETFQYLPRNEDEFFRQLWHEKRLSFEGREGQTDIVDIRSAQLTCASLSLQQSLLIILPDHAPRRMPLLFTTGLIMSTLDNRSRDKNQQVIYFGASASIKHYLSQTYIRNQKLSEIFNQTSWGRSTQSQTDISSNLPRVIFSYTPTNVKNVLQTYSPQWVFLDCGDGDKTDWVLSVLDKLEEKRIPGIACIQNPLTNIHRAFQEHSWNIFYCSPQSTSSETVTLTSQTEIIPYVIKSQLSLEQAKKYQSASRTLSGCARQARSRLQRDARRAVGHYVRGLENLLVPYRFFEAESKHYWGIYSLDMLRQTAARFVEAVETDGIGKALQKVLTEINPVHEQLMQNKPPLWLALEQLCIDPPRPEAITILVFQNRAYRQIFSLAMLAENNIAEHELQELNVWLVSLKQFTKWQLLMEKIGRSGIDIEGIPDPLKENHHRWYPILIGVPTKYNYPRYAHLLRHKQVGILLSPHLLPLATWHFNQWIAIFDQTLPQNFAVLQQLIPDPPTNARISANRVKLNRIIIAPEQDVLIDDKSEAMRSQMKELLKLAPRAEEFAYLMDEFTAQSEVNTLADIDLKNTAGYANPAEAAFIEKVIIVRFREKYEVTFNPTDRIQLIAETAQERDLQTRSVRSLRPGDSVLFINGQHRQNLYDLILSRVHDHPTFALHVSLIERWQDELITYFKKANISVSVLLTRMQAKGSKIQTDPAMRFWLSGQVMSPNDPKDLERIADILDMPFVKQYYRQIDRAARRLRGIHISLAHRLNTWLQQEAASSDAQGLNSLIDAELGLEFRDFQDALMILTVESVMEQAGLFLSTDLGQLKSVS